MHFGQYESGKGPEQDRNTIRVISDVLDYEKPDLVVLNGDLTNGDTISGFNGTHYIDQIVAPLIERNLTWASTYGNHDHSLYSSGDSILEREQMFAGSRTRKMVETDGSGTTNYYLPVYSAKCESTSSCAPQLLLWFFDSRGGSRYQGEAQPNWVDRSVADWFRETNEALVNKYNKTMPSLAFVHIPINATWSFQTQVGLSSHHQPGIDEEPACAQQGAGWCSNGSLTETCVYGGQDVPFMQALVSVPGLIGLFYGHDHGQTWCVKWDRLLPGMTVPGNGINLCYGQHSGYGGYGDWIRGAREIIVTEEQLKNFAVDTHIRLENGGVVGAVGLNATLNKDRYPATPNQLTFLSRTEENGDIAVSLAPSSEARRIRWGGFLAAVQTAILQQVLGACLGVRLF